jgi:hypothetical protein
VPDHDDDFDRIVEGLDLDLSFPDEPADPAPQPPVLRWEPEDPDRVDQDEPFYRRVEPTPLVPRRRGLLLAWIGLAGAPLTLVLATVSHVFLDRPVLAGAVLIFVASATYLFLQLPEHGPGRRDWPDDGAVL